MIEGFGVWVSPTLPSSSRLPFLLSPPPLASPSSSRPPFFLAAPHSRVHWVLKGCTMLPYAYALLTLPGYNAAIDCYIADIFLLPFFLSGGNSHSGSVQRCDEASAMPDGMHRPVDLLGGGGAPDGARGERRGVEEAGNGRDGWRQSVGGDAWE
eukprot:3941365-Rhodomonas_salina.3